MNILFEQGGAALFQRSKVVAGEADVIDGFPTLQGFQAGFAQLDKLLHVVTGQAAIHAHVLLAVIAVKMPGKLLALPLPLTQIQTKLL